MNSYDKTILTRTFLHPKRPIHIQGELILKAWYDNIIVVRLRVVVILSPSELQNI